MTAPVIHQCPRCELRFSFRSEMEQHLRDDHPRPVSEERQAAAKPAEVPIAPAPPLPVVAPAAEPVRSASTRARLTAFVLAVIAVLAVAYVAVNVSLWAAALIAAAVLLLAVTCVRRARGRPRIPRR